MIHELYLYLTEKADPRARQFSHLKESIALIKRQKRCAEFWQDHQNQSKELILNSIDGIITKESLLILGTGPLHEIPIHELALKFKRIVLVDIVHLKSVKETLKNYSNIEFVEHDITELETTLASQKKLINKIPERFLNESFDFVISSNILSQLAIHLKSFIQKKMKKIQDIDLTNFCYRVTQDHYEYLKLFNCPVLLITDIETYIHHKKTNITEIETPYINFSLPVETKSWIWNLAPAPEIHPQISLQMKVVGIILK